MIRRILTLFFLAAAVLVWADRAHARTAVSGFRLGIHPDGITRFVMDLSDRMEFSSKLLTDPYRIVIETEGLSWTADPVQPRPVGTVLGVTYMEAAEGGRIMLELKRPAEIKGAFLISPRDGQGWRLVVDLKETTREAFLAAAQGGRPEPVPAPRILPPAQAKAAPPAPDPVPQPRPQLSVNPAVVSAEPTANTGRIVVASPAVQNMAAPEPPVPQARVAPPAAEPAPAPVIAEAPSVAPAPVPTPMPRPTDAIARSSTGPVLSAPIPPVARPAFTEPKATFTEPKAADAAAEPLPVTKVAMAPAPLAEPPRRLGKGAKPVIVIDPGHGGADPGAIGVSGIYEKFITLTMARELKTALERSGQYEVHLTRTDDVFIRLRDRVAIARGHHADLFISLHADVVKDPQIRGLSVYTVSQNASDSEAQALADKENKADLIAGIDLSHESADVATILIDLAQRETMNRSAGFAGSLVEEVSRLDGSLLENTHRFAGFAVLKAPDVPAVLVEMGYLSNPDEERNLRQPEYRQKLARAISRSVDRFMAQAPKAARP